MADDDPVEGNGRLPLGLEEAVLGREQELVEEPVRELENLVDLDETVRPGAELALVVVHQGVRLASEPREKAVVEVPHERARLLALLVARGVGADAGLGARVVDHALHLEVREQLREIEPFGAHELPEHEVGVGRDEAVDLHPELAIVVRMAPEEVLDSLTLHELRKLLDERGAER